MPCPGQTTSERPSQFPSREDSDTPAHSRSVSVLCPKSVGPAPAPHNLLNQCPRRVIKPDRLCSSIVQSSAQSLEVATDRYAAHPDVHGQIGIARCPRG